MINAHWVRDCHSTGWLSRIGVRSVLLNIFFNELEESQEINVKKGLLGHLIHPPANAEMSLWYIIQKRFVQMGIKGKLIASEDNVHGNVLKIPKKKEKPTQKQPREVIKLGSKHHILACSVCCLTKSLSWSSKPMQRTNAEKADAKQSRSIVVPRDR